ncbi:MAG: 4-hydroxy-tetrahydrodipicolinate reductase [Victivallales bacterium]|nr:4-hydroxy-tetrahydrodipicolinate reductase [Victivallales bacterium]
MFRIIVVGAAGRMGRRIINCIDSAADMMLAGATEHKDSPFVGKDASAVAGLEASGVIIGSDLSPLLPGSDSVIDFSTGDVVGNAAAAADAGVSYVIGTTGLDEHKRQSLALLAKNGARILFAPNMSVGVNLLFHLAGKVAATLGEEYNIEIVEMHHNKKKDSPSGTAVRLAELAAEARGSNYQQAAVNGRSGMVGERKPSEIGIHAVRGGDVVGEHVVIFAADGERIEIAHKASSRDTFAIGSLKAVRFLAGMPPGLYDMQDALGLK